MSRLPDHLSPPAIKISVQRLACFDCGSETNATCTCGVAYLPKAVERVAEYDEANPGQSTRQAAADLGITSGTVTKARQSRASTEAPETVTGRDGKTYPATKPAAIKPQAPEQPEDLILQAHAALTPVLELIRRMTPQERTRFREQVRERWVAAMRGEPDIVYF